jgi:hypothetical protein
MAGADHMKTSLPTVPLLLFADSLQQKRVHRPLLSNGCTENTDSFLVASVSVIDETYIPCHCLAITASTPSIILAFSHHVPT